MKAGVLTIIAMMVLVIVPASVQAGGHGHGPSYWAQSYNSDQVEQLTDDDWTYINSQTSILYKYTYTQYKPSTGESLSFTVPEFTLPYREWLFSEYMRAASTKVLEHDLSAQLIAAELNVRHNFLDGNAGVRISGYGTTTINGVITDAQIALATDDSAKQAACDNALRAINGGNCRYV
jgi:hypothetical protein